MLEHSRAMCHSISVLIGVNDLRAIMVSDRSIHSLLHSAWYVSHLGWKLYSFPACFLLRNDDLLDDAFVDLATVSRPNSVTLVDLLLISVFCIDKHLVFDF